MSKMGMIKIMRATIMCLICTLILSLALPAIAVPSDISRQLLADPISVMDFGLYKLEKSFDTLVMGLIEADVGIDSASTTAEYNAEKDKIIMNMFFTIDPALNEEDLRKVTEITHASVRQLPEKAIFRHGGFNQDNLKVTDESLEKYLATHIIYRYHVRDLREYAMRKHNTLTYAQASRQVPRNQLTIGEGNSPALRFNNFSLPK
jgi:hypothetical protein